MQGIRCRWYDEEKTVIYEELGTRWDWSDLEQLMDDVDKMLAETTGQVDFIADLRQTRMLPATMLIHNFKRFCDFTAQNPRYGHTMAVGMSGFVRGFWQMFSNVYDQDAKKLQMELANSVEDAYARILERRRIIDKAS